MVEQNIFHFHSKTDIKEHSKSIGHKGKLKCEDLPSQGQSSQDFSSWVFYSVGRCGEFS